MSMVVVLAVVAVQAVGGVDQMKAKLAVIDRAKGLSTGTAGSALSFVPDLNSAWMPMITFLVYISINWWATWYPGAEPGGGGYIAQRMFSAKNERHSLLATLWFNVAHYAIRPWPWVLVGLASVILYPNLADPETGYIRVLIDYLPPYLRGLMVAAFLAAYMSTIGTQLNWGASYLVNDFYRRFWKPNESERHYVAISQWSTVFLTIVSAVVTFYMDSIAGAWKLLIVTGAGTGTVLILRWYWWRINAWSEVSAMAAAFVVSVVLQTAYGMNSDDPIQFAHIMLITVGLTTAVWLATTYLTAPEPEPKLLAFYRKVRPSVFGWRPIAKLAPETPPSRDFGWNLLDWLCGCVLIYGTLFGTGKIILKETGLGLFFLVCAVIAGATIYWDLNRRGWKTVSE
jgi:Na+/proline symporter